jgi:selenocysteine lyase/cysteine desulfurase
LFVKHEHLNRLRPLVCGWNSVQAGSDYTRIELNVRDECSRYEGGSQNMVGMLALGASLDLLAGLGLSPSDSPLAQQVLATTDYACERLLSLGATLLAPREPGNRSGIVTFEMAGRDPHDIRQRLAAAGIIVRCRAGGVRISPHAYNTEDEVDRFIAELEGLPA